MALALIGSDTVACAATITVDSIADDTNAGHCTLREAINSANGSSGTGNCTAGTGTDTIVFSVTGTIILGSKLPVIAGKLTITGPAAPGITIDGNNKFQVMEVDLGATLNLNKLTITRGNFFAGEGGGIRNSGTLTVANCTFSANSAEAGDGGGIFNSGTLTVTNSTFTTNSAAGMFGGGINNRGMLTVTSSTFSGNIADGGAGISSNGGATVTNSTFSTNIAGIGGGGIQNAGGTLTVTNSTFLGNGAGVAGGGVDDGGRGMASLKGTILAGQTTGGNCDTTITDAGYNISDDGSCGFSAAGSHNRTDPKLDSAGLKDNGGPTHTIALQTGSPAIDAIPFASCTDQAVPSNRLATDQRGFGRPDPEDGANGPCDIGAYESGQPPPTPTKTPTPTRTPKRTLTPTTGLLIAVPLDRRRKNRWFDQPHTLTAGSAHRSCNPSPT